MTHLLIPLVLFCTAFAASYQLFQLVAALRFFRRPRERWTDEARFRPPVTILKPLKGPGLDLHANLVSFCRQTYPTWQIVFGVDDASDPAVAVVHQLRREFPDRDIVLSVGREAGANGKVASLARMMRHARHDLLVVSDADIRVHPDYLDTVVAPLGDPTVGLATTLYRSQGRFGWPSVLESLLINTDSIPMFVTAEWVQGLRNAYGATIAFRRQALEQIGGFAALSDHLADDYMLGQRIAAAGWRIVLLPYVVDTILDSTSLREVWTHQVRWARTYRVQQPVGWFCSVITHAVTWGALALAVTGGSAAGWLALTTAIGCRLTSLAGIMALIGERETLRWLWLVPLKDLAYTAIWVVSWLGRDVTWSGERFRVGPDGRMTPRIAPAPSQLPRTDELDARRHDRAADARA